VVVANSLRRSNGLHILRLQGTDRPLKVLLKGLPGSELAISQEAMPARTRDNQ
jgi:hypothetical protein